MGLTLQEEADTVALYPLALRLDSSHPPRLQATVHLTQATELHLSLHAPAMKHQGCPMARPADLATVLNPTRRPAADMDHLPRLIKHPVAPADLATALLLLLPSGSPRDPSTSPSDPSTSPSHPFAGPSYPSTGPSLPEATGRECTPPHLSDPHTHGISSQALTTDGERHAIVTISDSFMIHLHIHTHMPQTVHFI